MHPQQTAEVKKGSLQGRSLNSNRGILPGLKPVFPKNGFSELFSTALSGTLFYEGRALSAFARDPNRRHSSGQAVQVSQLGQQYGLRDERGIRSPMLLSLKFMIFCLPPFLPFARLANPPTLVGSPPTATPLQQFVFGTVPDFHVPQWVFKLIQGNPVTFGWPL